jgi:hypothetical protein
MKIIDLIIENKLSEAKNIIREKLDSIVQIKLEEVKRYVVEKTYVESEEELTEAVKKSTNIVKMGRIKRIRRRIRRNNKGRIVVQRNRVTSAVKGYRVQGTQLKRITATQRINKTRKLKRYWKAKGRARLQRTLLKRKMSMRRRSSMGIR